MAQVREPSVAGQFYSNSPVRLADEVAEYVESAVERQTVLGIVVPHAGFMYSGQVAGAVYSRIYFPDTFVLLGPNHHGVGADAAIMSNGVWRTPLGDVAIDKELAAKLKSYSPSIEEDSYAHRREHSLEVQIPFMQHFSSDFRIVPIAVSTLSYETCKAIAVAIARAIQETPYPVVVVASTDMTHFEPQVSAQRKDQLAINKILALDPAELYSTVREHRISMCGVIPTTITLIACVQLGAQHAELVRYMTSGDVTGSYFEVVGYAGILII